MTLAALAALSLTATPSLARDRYGDWNRHHRHRGGDGIDAGSLLAGLLVGGAAVAIATSAGKKSSDGRGDDRGDEPAPYRYPGGPVAGDQGYGDAPVADDRPLHDVPGDVGQGSFGAAVDACSAELERGSQRIDSVDGVRRMGERYSVEGRLQDGRPYACSVDDTGHIRSVAVDGHAMT
ncbi:MAG TPA: hypothetical protein VMQ93_06615 [Novosphingobium sp.]|nr:hypothetical protein [Novosphingobium sp.]